MSRRHTAAGALGAALASLVLAAPADARDPSCRPASVKAVAGQALPLKLNCTVTARGKAKVVARGTTGKTTRKILTKPKQGTLVKFSAKKGTAVYTARAGFAGTDTIVYRVSVPGGKRYRATVRIKVTRPTAGTPVPPPTGPAGDPPASPPAQQPDSPPTDPGPGPDPGPAPGDGLPAVLPAAPGSVAYTTRAWQPSAVDTCPKAVHDRFAVIGPDGKKYPSWHPPAVVDPATGQKCTFGHEHGRDAHGSDLYDWVAAHFASAGKEEFSGVPFGLTTEALDAYSAANPGTATRQEDNVGYKVDYENDVALIGADGGALGVTCDYVTLVHQGSHSPDATQNNVHDTLYAVRCTDGTEVIASTLSRFGNGGEYTRACDPGTKVTTLPTGYPGGAGERSIPDRACVESVFLVPPGRTTSVWALYEKWTSTTELKTNGGDTLVAFDAAWGVFNPSRYADPAAGSRLGRTIAACRETESNGDRANGQLCEGVLAGATYDSVSSPLNGTHRDVYLEGTAVDNAGGPQRWYTDPYGGNASETPFPGAICQLVGSTSTNQAAQTQVFGRNRTNNAEGVHAPN